MTGFVNPLAPRSRSILAGSGDLKRWAREHLGLSDDVIVSVNQIACREPGCPDVETVIGILRPGHAPEIYKIERPIGDIVEADVAEAVKGRSGRDDANRQS